MYLFISQVNGTGPLTSSIMEPPRVEEPAGLDLETAWAHPEEDIEDPKTS